jgi:hypothetical protein
MTVPHGPPRPERPEPSVVEEWIGERPDPTLHKAYGDVLSSAEWSHWRPFAEAIADAPRLPGVYLLREPTMQVIRYVRMAGERLGGGRAQGLRGRLAIYRSGKGAVSGFGEAALDRALGDPDWVAHQLDHLIHVGPQRAKQWAADAVARLAPEICWATTRDKASARALEAEVVGILRPHGIWNR